ncbi:M23 family metallopeptidase [Treponema berlinense]|uniref:M23 family metallopeptidase n=1 Tax=Treponema berlinense TaxID=225004 RepID=UPI0026EBFA40|nr:peptidoglycan DD-metalloendopeptidase family protein [Treponema berlinense]
MKNEKTKDFFRRICACGILFCYCLNILPAGELKFSMEKSLERLDFYLEAGKNYSERDWKKLAEKSVLAALEDWESENLHLKDAAPEMYEDAFLEAEKNLKLETEKKYFQWLCLRSRERSVFENSQKLRLKISQAAADFDAADEKNGNFSDLQRSFAEKTESVIGTFLTELEAEGDFDGFTLEQIEKEGKMLAEAEQSRFLTRFLADKTSGENEKIQKAASSVGQKITERTVEQTDLLVTALFDSFEEKIENPDCQSPETENLLEKFDAVFGQGLKLWEQAEADFLSERMEWERQAGDTFYETEKIWQAALEELNQKKLDWEMKVQERIGQIQEKIASDAEKYRQKISESLKEYAASLENQLNSKLQAASAYSGIYSNLRQGLAAVYSGICASCESLESENSEKYRGLYSYWKTEAQENVAAIDGDFCLKLKQYIEENENLKGDRKAASFYGWFEQARDYNLKLRQVVEKLDGLSGAGAGSAGSDGSAGGDGSAGSDGSGGGFSELELEIYRIEIQQKYWLEEREIAEAAAEYVQADRAARKTEEEALQEKLSAEQKYELACDEYEKSLENLNLLEQQVQSACTELEKSWEAVEKAEQKLEAAEEDYRSFYKKRLGIDEETLVLQISSCLEKLQSAQKNRDDVLQFFYENGYSSQEKTECEKLVENDAFLQEAWKKSVNCLEELKKKIEENDFLSAGGISGSEIFRAAKEKIDGFYGTASEKTGYEIQGLSGAYGEQIRLIEEKIEGFDSLCVQFLQKAEAEKKLIDKKIALERKALAAANSQVEEDEEDEEADWDEAAEAAEEKYWQKKADDELNEKMFADRFSLQIMKAEILCLVTVVLNWERQKKAELEGLESFYEEDYDSEDWYYYESLTGFMPEIDDYYSDLSATLKNGSSNLTYAQKNEFEKKLKNFREQQEEIYETVKEADEENRKAVRILKSDFIKSEREKVKKSLYKTISGSPVCTESGYEDVLNFCYSLMTAAGSGTESVIQGVENFTEAYLRRESFRYCKVLKAEVNLEALEKEIASLNAENSAFEKAMEESSAAEGLEKQEKTDGIEGQEVEKYLKNSIRVKFLTFLQEDLKNSPVLYFETLNKYDFQKNSYLTESERSAAGQILENCVDMQLKNLENAVLQAAKVFGVKADSRLARSDSENSSILSKASDYEFYDNLAKKQAVKLSLLAETFEDFSSQETRTELEAKNQTKNQCSEELRQSLEKYESKTGEYEKIAAAYEDAVENSKTLYEQTEKCRLEKRKAQAVYDCSQNIYLDYVEEADFEIFESPSARLEQAETVLERLDFTLSVLKEFSGQKTKSSISGANDANDAGEEGSLSACFKNFTEADRNYYLACVLNQKITSAVEKEREALKLAEKNEKIFRESLVIPLKTENFVFTECVNVEYSDEDKKYSFSLNKNSSETEEQKQKNTETQKEFFTACSTAAEPADSGAENAEEGDFITAAETEILDWLSKMLSDEEYFKTVILASVYWLSEKDTGYENSVYSTAMNTDREMGDAHGIGADDYFKRYIINTARDAFLKLENTVNEEDIAKCVLFRKSSSFFAESISTMEKNLLRSLAFAQVEEKMDKRKKDNDCCYWIVKLFTGCRAYNSKGRAAINYSERAEALKKSTYMIYESFYSELSGNFESYKNALKNKEAALKNYKEVLFGKKDGAGEEDEAGTSGEDKKLSRQQVESMLKDSVFADLNDGESAENELLEIVRAFGETEESDEFENILDFSEKLVNLCENSLQTASEELNEKSASAEKTLDEARKKFSDSIFIWSGDEKFDENEIKNLASLAFGENSLNVQEIKAGLLDYYKKYFKNNLSFTMENLNEAKDWFYFFSNLEEPDTETEEPTDSSEPASSTEPADSVEPVTSTDSAAKSVMERYLSHFCDFEILKENFCMNRQQIFLEGVLQSWEKENEDVLEQLYLISAVSQREWSRAEEKLNARYNSWLWNFSKEYVQSDGLWQENYEEFLSGKQMWISQMYESAAAETGFAGLDGEKSAENALKKLKLKKIEEVEKQEFDSSSIVGELLKTSALSSLKNHFENVSFRVGQSNFYVPVSGAKTFRNEEMLEIQKIAGEVSRMMKKTSEKHSALTAAEVLENSIAQEFEKISAMNEAVQKQVQNMVFEEGYSQKDSGYSRKVLVHSYLLKDTYKNQNVRFYSYFSADRPQFLYSMSSFEHFEENSLSTIFASLQKELADWIFEIFGSHDGSSDIDGLIDLHIGTLPGEKSAGGSGQLGSIYRELEENRNEMLAGLSEMELAPWDKQIAPSSVSWVEVPSLRGLCTYATAIAASVVLSVVSFGSMAAPLAALCTAGISAAITSSTEATFAALDVCGGYKSWTEAGKQLAASAVTNSISALGGAAGAVVQGAGGIAGALLKMGVDATASVAGSAAASAVYTGSFSTFARGLTDLDSWSSSLVRGLGGFTASALGTIDYTGFNLNQMQNISRFNSLVGGLTGNAAEYALTGQTSFNLLNLSQFSDNRLNSGLVELKIGKQGAKLALGTGGTDINYSTLNSAFSGAMDFRKNIQIEAYSRSNSMNGVQTSLRLQHGFGGESEQKLLEEILSGKTKIAFSQEENGRARTEFDGNSKTVILNASLQDLSVEDQFKLGIILSHESFRDGITDNSDGQKLETVSAVYGHTIFAEKIASDSAYRNVMTGILSSDSDFSRNLRSDFEAVYSGNPEKLKDYVEKNYDSSADYWKLTSNGDIEYDGRTNLTDEFGNVLHKSDATGLESSLVEILCGKNATAEQKKQVQDLMAEVFSHRLEGNAPENRDKWYWNGSVTKENMGKKIEAEKVFGDYSDTIATQAFARYYDDVTSYMVGEYLNLDMGNSMPSSVQNRKIPSSQKARQRIKDLCNAKIQFLQNQSALVDTLNVTVSTAFKEVDLKHYFKYANLHFGIDLATGENRQDNIEGKKIFSGFSGRVSTVTDLKTSPKDGNGIYIEYGYGFEGKFISTGYKGEYLHMKEKSTLSVGEVIGADTTIGFVGNTGTASEGPHLHYTTFTEKNTYRSDLMGSLMFGANAMKDNMINSTENKTVYNPTAFYEANKDKIGLSLKTDSLPSRFFTGIKKEIFFTSYFFTH